MISRRLFEQQDLEDDGGKVSRYGVSHKGALLESSVPTSRCDDLRGGMVSVEGMSAPLPSSLWRPAPLSPADIKVAYPTIGVQDGMISMMRDQNHA